jgi:hypothetical protein
LDPVYFSHGYREREAPFAAHFASLMQQVSFLPSLDPPSEDVNAAKLERHLGYTIGEIAVISNRTGGPSAHILYEVSMCLKGRKPLLVFLEDTIPDGLISDRILQFRFSSRSYIREVQEHLHAIKLFRSYVGNSPLPRYQGAVRQRSCVLIGFKSLKSSYQEGVVEELERRGYKVIQYMDSNMGTVQPGSIHFEITNCNLAICCVDTSLNVDNYLLGVLQDALVPTILISSNKNSPLNPNIPNEYQSRWVDPKNELSGIKVIRSQIDLFEEDFIELDKESEANAYAHMLALSSSTTGEYSHDTRTHIIQEVTMGDKYITKGQVGAVGSMAHAHDINFNQIWDQSEKKLDLKALATELNQLREHLRKNVTLPEHDVAIGAIANAEVSASQGNGADTISWLSKTGEWSLDAATKIGVGVATAALKMSLGI